MARRCLKFLFKAVFVVVLLVVGFAFIERWRGQVSLARYHRQLIARGEKLTPREFATVAIPLEQNAAVAITNALARLQIGIVAPYNTPQAMSLVPSGRAVVGFREPAWVEKDRSIAGSLVVGLFTNTWSMLATDLRSNQVVLTGILAILEKPVSDNQVDLANFKAPFTHLTAARNLQRWLCSAVQLALHEGRTADALDYLTREIRLPQWLAEDRVIISELVRIAIAAVARADTWEALQSSKWTDAQLAQLQTAWAEQSFIETLARNMAGERVFCNEMTEALRRSNDDCYEVMWEWAKFWNPEEAKSDWIPEFWKRQVYCRVWRFTWSHQAQRRALENVTFLVDETRAATTNRSLKIIKPVIEARLAVSERRHFYDRWRFPEPDLLVSLHKVIERAMKAETERALTLGAIALKRYSLRHGKYPPNLDVLVPEFLPAVPIDHMDGKPIRYKLNADQSFTLYSVGEDLEDNTGDASPREGVSGRLPWQRKDHVWPQPATPEEVIAWREKQLKQ